MTIGTVVHDVLHVLLVRLSRTTSPIDVEKFDDFVRRAVDRAIAHATLDEVAYGVIDLPPSADILSSTAACLRHFLDSERYKWFVNAASHEAGVWIIEPPGFGETRLDGMKLYCKVDALVGTGSQYYLFDWKTGRRDQEKHRKQLVGYASWATFHLSVDPEFVHPTVVYLKPEYAEYSETFNSLDLEAFRIQVRAETEEMKSYCRDVAQNIPLEKARFPQIDNPRVCEHCPFRGLCFPAAYRATLS